MLCQGCKQRTATIHLTEISSGQRSEVHLCEKCAQQQGIAVKSQIPLNELLSTLLAVQSQESASEVAEERGGEVACPHCGMTLKRYSKISLLGCPHDYDVFQDTLLPLIEKSQAGHTEHVGKVPSTEPTDTKRQMQLAQLRQQLERAVRDEDYETAAKLRDQIRQLQ